MSPDLGVRHPLRTAVAAVAPTAVSDRTRAAVAELRTTADGGTWDITQALAASGNQLDARPRASH
ncbi:hypothetical protein [Streptomyces sp. NBC_00057]|uniref:hypothetical protein n=1 Tax=Streptomyces sp. NBC_00057 TaxID=2975634 RepID=UPI00324A4302